MRDKGCNNPCELGTEDKSEQIQTCFTSRAFLVLIEQAVNERQRNSECSYDVFANIVRTWGEHVRLTSPR